MTNDERKHDKTSKKIVDDIRHQELSIVESLSEEEFQSQSIELFIAEVVDGMSNVLLRPSTLQFVVGDYVGQDVIFKNTRISWLCTMIPVDKFLNVKKN
jgi:hypothetical protein